MSLVRHEKRSESFNLKLVFSLSPASSTSSSVVPSLAGSANIFHLLFFAISVTRNLCRTFIICAIKNRFSVHSYHLFSLLSIAFAEKCRHKGQIAIFNAHDVTHILLPRSPSSEQSGDGCLTGINTKRRLTKRGDFRCSLDCDCSWPTFSIKRR